MRVWLLHIGERIALDGDVRLGRYSYLSESLISQGHEVVRWVPSFVHVLKKQRSHTTTDVFLSDHHKVKIVRNPAYKRNVSIRRGISYRILARHIKQLLDAEPEPDVIVAAIPTVGITRVVQDYAEKRGIPVVVDVRDLWPDIFLSAVPPYLRLPGRFVLLPFRKSAQHVLRRATAITGVSRAYVEWGLSGAGRKSSDLDKPFPLGYERYVASYKESERAWQELRCKGVDPTATIIVYFGQLSATYDLETLLDAALSVTSQHENVQFVVCGTGEKAHIVDEVARTNKNIISTGWVSPSLLTTLLGKAVIGLATYTRSAPQSIPNKPIEYLSGGLVLVSSLKGEMEALIKNAGCGLTYSAGDPSSLAETISTLLTDPERMHKMQDRAKELFESKFSAHLVYSQMADYLATIAVSKRLRQKHQNASQA